MVDSPLILNLAMSQADLADQAPDPGKVVVDNRSFAQLLSLTIDHGRLIRYFKEDGVPDGDWGSFFAADRRLALASLTSLDSAAIDRRMQEVTQRLWEPDAPLCQPQPWRDLVTLIESLLSLLNPASPSAGTLATRLDQVAHPIELLDAASRLSHFLLTSGLDSRLGEGPISLSGSQQRHLTNLLRDFLGVLLTSLERRRKEAMEELSRDLEKTTVPPPIALAIAFTRLLPALQHRLNAFPKALLEFYQKDVLHLNLDHDHTLRPDRLYLSLRQKQDAPALLVPRSTLFSAGVDADGQAITYATDQDLMVLPVSLSKLQILRMHGKIDLSGATPAVVCHSASQTTVPAPLPDPVVGPHQRLFGTDQPKISAPGVTHGARFGFALVSPLLKLNGGHRVVRLTIVISTSHLQALASTLDRSQDEGVLEAMLKRIQTTLVSHLAWSDSLAPEGQALTFSAVSQEPPPTGSQTVAVELQTELGSSAPPWGGHSHGDHSRLLCAVWREGNNKKGAEHESLKLLSRLQLHSIQLQVEVSDLRPTIIQSSGGMLDPSKPMPVFGPSPVVGSFFSVFAPEIGVKPIDTITLHIDWHDLPINSDGFIGYYNAYRLDAGGHSHPLGQLFDNDCFRVTLHLENDASGTNPRCSSDLPLFVSLQPQDSAPSSSQPPARLAPATSFSLTQLQGQTGSKALRIVLSSPPYAFGQALYTSNCIDASRRLALLIQAELRSPPPDDTDHPQPSIDWPNPPWCPTAASACLDYTSAVSIDSSVPTETGACMTLFHITPFDDLQAVRWPPGEAVALFPTLLTPDPKGKTSAGLLSMGTLQLKLSHPVAQISLLVGLTGSHVVAHQAAPSTMTITAWIGDRWTTLPPQNIQDGTIALSQTGLLRLTVPDGQTSELFRLNVWGLSKDMPMLTCLEVNAVGATWQGPGGKADLSRSLPAGTVRQPVDNIPFLDGVHQPLPSSGGVAAAQSEQMDGRLAERLGHKDRAIQADDYTRILLRAFPFLWQVVVLPAWDPQVGRMPGCVSIIPIPGPDAPTLANPLQPRCDAALAARVLDELRPRVSPFVRLRVGKVNYCSIMVMATVVLRDDTCIASSLQKLQNDLVAYLSPWPNSANPHRPKHYFKRDAIMHFIRHHSYVRSVVSIKLEYSANYSSHVYYTSAALHYLKAETADLPMTSTARDIEP